MAFLRALACASLLFFVECTIFQVHGSYFPNSDCTGSPAELPTFLAAGACLSVPELGSFVVDSVTDWSYFSSPDCTGTRQAVIADGNCHQIGISNSIQVSGVAAAAQTYTVEDGTSCSDVPIQSVLATGACVDLPSSHNSGSYLLVGCENGVPTWAAYPAVGCAGAGKIVTASSAGECATATLNDLTLSFKGICTATQAQVISLDYAIFPKHGGNESLSKELVGTGACMPLQASLNPIGSFMLPDCDENHASHLALYDGSDCTGPGVSVSASKDTPQDFTFGATTFTLKASCSPKAAEVFLLTGGDYLGTECNDDLKVAQNRASMAFVTGACVDYDSNYDGMVGSYFVVECTEDGSVIYAGYSEYGCKGVGIMDPTVKGHCKTAYVGGAPLSYIDTCVRKQGQVYLLTGGDFLDTDCDNQAAQVDIRDAEPFVSGGCVDYEEKYGAITGSYLLASCLSDGSAIWAAFAGKGCVGAGYMDPTAVDTCKTAYVNNAPMSYKDRCVPSQGQVYLLTGGDYLGEKCNGNSAAIREAQPFVTGACVDYDPISYHGMVGSWLLAGCTTDGSAIYAGFSEYGCVGAGVMDPTIVDTCKTSYVGGRPLSYKDVCVRSKGQVYELTGGDFLGDQCSGPKADDRQARPLATGSCVNYNPAIYGFGGSWLLAGCTEDGSATYAWFPENDCMGPGFMDPTIAGQCKTTLVDGIPLSYTDVCARRHAEVYLLNGGDYKGSVCSNTDPDLILAARVDAPFVIGACVDYDDILYNHMGGSWMLAGCSKDAAPIYAWYAEAGCYGPSFMDFTVAGECETYSVPDVITFSYLDSCARSKPQVYLLNGADFQGYGCVTDKQVYERQNEPFVIGACVNFDESYLGVIGSYMMAGCKQDGSVIYAGFNEYGCVGAGSMDYSVKDECKNSDFNLPLSYRDSCQKADAKLWTVATIEYAKGSCKGIKVKDTFKAVVENCYGLSPQLGVSGSALFAGCMNGNSRFATFDTVDCTGPSHDLKAEADSCQDFIVDEKTLSIFASCALPPTPPPALPVPPKNPGKKSDPSDTSEAVNSGAESKCTQSLVWVWILVGLAIGIVTTMVFVAVWHVVYRKQPIEQVFDVHSAMYQQGSRLPYPTAAPSQAISLPLSPSVHTPYAQLPDSGNV